MTEKTPSVLTLSALPICPRQQRQCIPAAVVWQLAKSIQGGGVIGATTEVLLRNIGLAFNMDWARQPGVSQASVSPYVRPSSGKGDFTDKRVCSHRRSRQHVCVIVQTARRVRAALGEEFRVSDWHRRGGKMVSALKMLGFDKVFDTDFSADPTIMEEAHEFRPRTKRRRSSRLPPCSRMD